jgi:ABC1 atypical kinase-like domain
MITPLLLYSLLSQPGMAFVLSPTCIGSRGLSLPTRDDKRVHVVVGLALNNEWTELTSRITSASIKFQAPIPEDASSSFQPLSELLGLEKWLRFLPLDDDIVETIVSSSNLESNVALFVALPLPVKLGIALVPLTLTMLVGLYNMAFLAPEDFREGMVPYPRGKYDPIQAKAYYSRHNRLVLQRTSQVFRLTNGLFCKLLFDKYILRDEERNRAQRANELLELVTKLGPTAIKIGQALSVRPDLIPEEYAKALSSLQDQVPPFDGKDAKETLRRELGPEKYSHLKDFPFMSQNSGPVASASIGQVYRGFIDAQEVAVKVQRPNVLAEIALDLHLVREFAPIYKKLTRTATDLQALTDEWGKGFIAELDYRKEAESTMRFTQEMRKRNINAVSAPIVITDYCTEQVLVTEWIDGVRIDRSDADDIPRLCAVALNAYLVMLLELQSLHCDPHPGKQINGATM